MSKEIPESLAHARELYMDLKVAGHFTEGSGQFEIHKIAQALENYRDTQFKAIADFVNVNGTKPVASSSMKHVEYKAILKAMEKHAFNKTKAAESLGITRQTLNTKIKKHEKAGK